MNTSEGNDQLVKLDADHVISTSGLGVLLVKAARAGRADLVEALIRSDARINDANLDATTALHAAAESGHLTICERLIRLRANPNMKNRLNKTALNMVPVGHSIAFDSNGKAVSHCWTCSSLATPCSLPSTLLLNLGMQLLLSVRLLVSAAADVSAANGDGSDPALH